MISLDLMKSSEVRIAGDWSNYVAVVISKWTRLTCFIKWLFSIPNIFWGRWHIYWLFHRFFFFTLFHILQHAFVFHICFLLFREHNTTYFFNDGWWICHFLLSDGPSVVKLRLQGKTLSAGKSHQIKCEAIGAKPQATITWWVGGKQVHKRSLSRRKKNV